MSKVVRKEKKPGTKRGREASHEELCHSSKLEEKNEEKKSVAEGSDQDDCCIPLGGEASNFLKFSSNPYYEDISDEELTDTVCAAGSYWSPAELVSKQDRNKSCWDYSRITKATTPSDTMWDSRDKDFPRLGSTENDAGIPQPSTNVWRERQAKSEEIKALMPANETDEEAMLQWALELSKIEAAKDEERRRKMEHEYEIQMQHLRLEDFDDFDPTSASNRSTPEVTTIFYKNSPGEEKYDLDAQKHSPLYSSEEEKAIVYGGAKPKFGKTFDAFGGWGLKENSNMVYRKSRVNNKAFDIKAPVYCSQNDYLDIEYEPEIPEYVSEIHDSLILRNRRTKGSAKFQEEKCISNTSDVQTVEPMKKFDESGENKESSSDNSTAKCDRKNIKTKGVGAKNENSSTKRKDLLNINPSENKCQLEKEELENISEEICVFEEVLGKEEIYNTCENKEFESVKNIAAGLDISDLHRNIWSGWESSESCNKSDLKNVSLKKNVGTVIDLVDSNIHIESAPEPVTDSFHSIPQSEKSSGNFNHSHSSNSIDLDSLEEDQDLKRILEHVGVHDLLKKDFNNSEMNAFSNGDMFIPPNPVDLPDIPPGLNVPPTGIMDNNQLLASSTDPQIMQQLLFLSNPFFYSQVQAIEMYYKSLGMPISLFQPESTPDAEKDSTNVSNPSTVENAPLCELQAMNLDTERKSSIRSEPPGIDPSIIELGTSLDFSSEGEISWLEEYMAKNDATYIPPPKPPESLHNVYEVHKSSEKLHSESNLSAFSVAQNQCLDVPVIQKEKIHNGSNESIKTELGDNAARLIKYEGTAKASIPASKERSVPVSSYLKDQSSVTIEKNELQRSKCIPTQTRKDSTLCESSSRRNRQPTSQSYVEKFKQKNALWRK